MEVLLERKEGDFQETDNDAVMAKIDSEGHVIALLNVRQNQSDAPVSVPRRDAAA